MASGFANNTLFAINGDFSGNPIPALANGLLTDGQFWIGSTALNGGGTHINVGKIVAGSAAVTVSYVSPNIVIDVAGSAAPIEKFTVQTGITPVVPSGGSITFNGSSVAAGTNPVRTNGSAANTMQLEVQISQAIAAADATKIGLCNFDSASFAVAATGFVTLANPSGTPWTDVTSATQTLAINNGYITDRGGGVTYTLPSTASLGDTIKIVGKLGLAVVAQNANQQILISSSSSTVGITGSITATNVGDSIELVCITAGASTVWRALSVVGNWTIA